VKILLTQAGEAKGVAPVFPLGLAYLAGSLSGNGYEIKGFDLPLNINYEDGLKQALAEFYPDIVGISLRNLDNQRYNAPVSYLPEAKNVVRMCRQSPKTKIVVGGSGFSIAPGPLLDYLAADFGVAGEGEPVIGSLVRAITEGIDCSNIPGVVTGHQENATVVKPQQIDGIDSILLPNRDIFEPKKYLQKKIVLNIRSKRGCPFKCIYCTTPQIEGSHMRLRSSQKVVDELEMLKKDYGAQEFYFTDNIFNYPIRHAESICEEIISRKLDIKWYCIANPCSLSRDVLQLMKKAGCYGLSIGNESGSPQILKNLRKNFTVEQVSQACLWCRELGINYTCFLLLGGPGENKKTVDESISLMERLKPSYLSINIGIRIYPNTELARLSRDEGVIDTDNDLLLPAFYLSAEIKDWIFDYIKEAGERNGWTYPTLAISTAEQ
jgi:radical SAM superfamily enzyme YgiQ (UPF0313 family)